MVHREKLPGYVLLPKAFINFILGTGLYVSVWLSGSYVP